MDDPWGNLFPTGPADYTPSPDNHETCPDLPPENPWGNCLGVPVYAVCGYTDYNCICDWFHWICLGPVPAPGTLGRTAEVIGAVRTVGAVGAVETSGTAGTTGTGLTGGRRVGRAHSVMVPRR
jgi:hypothetical protein